MSLIHKYVPDDRFVKAPPLPTHRPITKREAWEHYHAVYFDFKGHRQTSACQPSCNHRNPGELEAFCRDAWVWDYVSRFVGAGKGWDKQPDWKDGDPIVPEAVPDCTHGVPFISGNWSKIVEQVQQLHETALQMTERRAA